MNYTTSDAETIYKVAPQTVRNWAKEFARHLSVTANPTENRTRIFTEDDMKVLSLISQMKNEGKQYDEIHAALATGQRGDTPGLSPDEIRAIIAGDIERQLQLEIQILKRQLEKVEERAREADELRIENARLKALLDHTQTEDRKRLNELTEQLKEAQSALRQLEREKGEAYIKGVMETLERKGDLPKKE